MVCVKLLVVMPSKYVGNMVISMQALSATLDHYRDDQVSLLVDENFAGLMTLCFGGRCRLVFYPRREVSTSGMASRAVRFFRFVAALRSTAFDRVVDFDGTVVSARLTRLARSPEKVGPGFAKRPGVYTRTVPINRDVQHCFDDYKAMATAIGVFVENDRYLPIPPVPTKVWTDLARVAELEDLGRLGPVACMHPCATKDYKQWDIAKFARLADRLMDRGWCVVLVGSGDAEQRRVHAMVDLMTASPVNLHGRLNLLQLACLFQRAELFIGNDSGPMHLAAAADTRVIALFGPTELLRWQPRAAGVRIIKGVEPCSTACRPEACLHAYRCLASLSVEQVEQAVAESAPL